MLPVIMEQENPRRPRRLVFRVKFVQLGRWSPEAGSPDSEDYLPKISIELIRARTILFSFLRPRVRFSLPPLFLHSPTRCACRHRFRLARVRGLPFGSDSARSIHLAFNSFRARCIRSSHSLEHK